MSDAVLEVRGVSIGYEERVVCRNIDFTLHSGECLAIVGGSGSGRSSLIRIILGVEQPISGEVIFGDGLTKNDIGCLPQREPDRVSHSTVRDIVLSGCLRRGLLPFFTKADRQIMSERLHLVGIADIAGRRFSELSGGTQQKVMLARALCAAKKLLLLDDPVHGLDQTTTNDIYGLIETICMSGMPVVMVSSDPPAVLRLSTHILHLADEMAFFGTKEAYLTTYAGRMFEAGVIL